ncbi:cutinase family protein [Mycobacteroides abscessus]|uniref:Cutinase n=2 Tax=Mycobacteroides abscessus TaxID=36809 RepID=A0A829HRF4_9MYCO|nr:cutinase family protein [Mycobacteroides abscessus]ESV64998.1 cutinase family protein [Mycobacteroides abscessus MAB_091912_2446]AMU27498.1 cutinase [Mycobacteroides abscessus]AMU32293.1 cutinase [Mycobacteroides abscessus]AMU37178.1 cutinase [Mycobacteroides abscessus]AMU42226.1 cutinase [Mycobacteroides abscessus]
MLTAAARAAVVSVAAIMLTTGLAVVIPATASAACPNVEVSFARGRSQPPGLGNIGDAFVSALRNRVKNLSVYAVRYDANTDVGGGANDLSAHLQQTANNCPDTKLVVGGYSLGAGVVDTALGVPGPVQIGNFFSFDNPVPPEVGDHIRAIVTFGNIVNRFAPVQSLAGAYGDRVLDLCNDGDPVCMDGNQDTWKSHTSYPPALINQAADFAAARVN